jgi:LysR family transcriptional regulator of gallate degradation
LTGRHVSIGSLPMAGDVLVPRAAALALAAQPDLRLAVKDGTYDALIDMLRAADIDFVVGPLRGAAAAPDLVEEVLFVDRFVAVVRAGHPLLSKLRRKGVAAPLKQMVAYPWIGALPGTPAQMAFDGLFAAAGIEPPQVSLQAHSTAVVRSVLLSGDHIALVSPLQVRAEVDGGLLVHAGGPFVGTERAIGISQRRDALASSACAHVLACLRQATVEATGNK